MRTMTLPVYPAVAAYPYVRWYGYYAYPWYPYYGYVYPW
jgi:hypothetical protein